MAVLVVLLAVWWQQQTFRWPVIMVILLVAAPLLSWWSATAFQIADYRAGCDGLCPGFRGAPVSFYTGETAGSLFQPGMFVLNGLVYLVLLMGWSAVIYALLARGDRLPGFSSAGRVLLGCILILLPLATAPIYIPPPQALVRGDSQRVAINAQREVYMYDASASAPILRAGLEDVRPRLDGSPGMRVCLRTYTFFYFPIGHMYLDMTPEGVHSTGGGTRNTDQSCWE
jgi:hypothetical protein